MNKATAVRLALVNAAFAVNKPVSKKVLAQWLTSALTFVAMWALQHYGIKDSASYQPMVAAVAASLAGVVAGWCVKEWASVLAQAAAQPPPAPVQVESTTQQVPLAPLAPEPDPAPAPAPAPPAPALVAPVAPLWPPSPPAPTPVPAPPEAAPVAPVEPRVRKPHFAHDEDHPEGPRTVIG